MTRRSSSLAAILAVLPLTSLRALVWLYHDTGDERLTGALATQVFQATSPRSSSSWSFPGR